MQKASGQKWKAEWRVSERKIKAVKDIESYYQNIYSDESRDCKDGS